MKGKTARYILAALAGAALLSGCTREAEPLAPVVLTAVLEQADTRTAYDGTQGKLSWTEGDEVAVHVGSSYQTAEITPSDGHLAVSETASACRNYFAVYPASAADAANYGDPTNYVGSAPWNLLLGMLLVAPLAEELMFRLGLSFRRRTVALWAGLLPVVCAFYLCRCRT